MLNENTRNDGTFKAGLSLLSYRPPAEIQAAVMRRGNGWFVHRIEEGVGPVNIDNYQVEISETPYVAGGKRMTPPELFDFFRRNINAFLEKNTCEFSPYSGADKALWSSANPVGAVLHIDMYAGPLNMDDGSVVCADASPTHWVFSTVHTPGDFTHPVSGNREFGYYERDGKIIFYTMACDRLTRSILTGTDAVQSAVFNGGHNTWLGFQRSLVNYIKNKRPLASQLSDSATSEWRGARALNPWSRRVSWEELRRQHSPRTPWVIRPKTAPVDRKFKENRAW